MKKIILLLFAAFLFIQGDFAQGSYYQDFDGDDTLYYMQTFNVILDTSSQNIWQIGIPDKYYFDSAYSLPNAIVTDTNLPYPVNNISRFIAKIPYNAYGSPFTLQWVQKIDMDSAQDGGIVEISIDTGHTWQNAFSAPYVYNFQGIHPWNIDTLPTGEVAISGTDSAWEDVWLCLNLYGHPYVDTLQFRFTLKSDSINSNREGWMIDNFVSHNEVIHPVKEVMNDPYLMVYPLLTYGLIYIKPKIADPGFSIKSAELINEAGQSIATYNIGPNDSNINISDKPGGWYLLKVTTSAVTKTYHIWLNKNQ